MTTKTRKRKPDGFDRAKAQALRALRKGKIGMAAFYPLRNCPEEKAVAFIIAEGAHAMRLGRYLRRTR